MTKMPCRKQEMCKSENKLAWSEVCHCTEQQKISFTVQKHHSSDIKLTDLTQTPTPTLLLNGGWATRIILLDYVPLLKVQWCTEVTVGFARLIFWTVLRSLTDLISLQRRDFSSGTMSHKSGSWSILSLSDLAYLLQWKKEKQINEKEQLLPKLLTTIKNKDWKDHVEMRVNEFLSSVCKMRKIKATTEIEQEHDTHLPQL